MLTASAGAVKEFFGFASKRTDLNNAQDVRKAAINAEDAKAKDAIKKAVAKEDINEIRKLTGE